MFTHELFIQNKGPKCCIRICVVLFAVIVLIVIFFIVVIFIVVVFIVVVYIVVVLIVVVFIVVDFVVVFLCPLFCCCCNFYHHYFHHDQEVSIPHRQNQENGTNKEKIPQNKKVILSIIQSWGKIKQRIFLSENLVAQLESPFRFKENRLKSLADSSPSESTLDYAEGCKLSTFYTLYCSL